MKKRLLFIFLVTSSLFFYPAPLIKKNIRYLLPTCVSSDTPALSATSNTICSGTNCTISVAAGNQLNDAVKWYLYSGSCGGASIDSSATGNFTVAPVVSTTYFVRGEGGCTVPGTCASIVISVIATPTVQANTTASAICLADSVKLYGSGASSYAWSNGIGNNSYFSPNSTATYTVTGTTSGCSAIAAITITVNPRPAAPTITTGFPSPLCTRDSVQLSFTNIPGNSYNWYNSSSTAGWNVVGRTGFSQRAAIYQSLAFHPVTNEPYVAYMDAPNGNRTTVLKFNGVSWETVGSLGFSGGNSSHHSLAFHPVTHEPYVAFADASVGSKLRVMKYNGTLWENVGDAGFSLGMASFIKLVFNPQTNQPIVAYADNSLHEKIAVMSFNGSFWNVVGYFGFSDDKAIFIDLAIHPVTFEPYVIYSDLSSGYKNIVQKFNGSSWQTVASPSIGNGAVAYNCIAFHPVTNELYIAYQDNSTSAYKATVRKLSGSTVTTVGMAAFSPGMASWISMAFNHATNEPYVAYTDHANGNRTSVMRFNGINWQLVGAAGTTAGNTNYNSLKFKPSTNEPYLAFSNLTDTSKTTVLKYSLSSSSSTNNPFTVNGAGTFGAIATNSFGCSSKSTNEIVVNSTPIVKANATKTTLCQGEPVTLTGGGTAQNYSWSNGAINNSAFSPTVSAYYSVTGTNASGCSNLDSVFLTVRPIPAAVASPAGPVDLCTGDSILLSAPFLNGNAYCWHNVSSLGWQNVGIPGFSSSNAYHQSIAIHPVTYEPYVAFSDPNNSSKTTVMKFNGSSWQIVGLPGFTNYYTNTNGILFHPVTKEPYVVVSGNNYNIDVMRFNGTAWVNVGPSNIMEGSNPQLIFNPLNNEPYVIGRSSLNGMPVTVIRFSGGAWQTVGNSTTLNTSYFGGTQSIAFHPVTNELYIAFSGYPAGPTTQFGIMVKKLFNTNWIVSNSTNLQTGDYPYLFFHPQTNEPYLAMSKAGKVCVMKQTNIWQYVGNPNISNGVANDYAMRFNPVTNEHFISYMDAANKMTVKKFNGSSWITIGNPAFTSSTNSYPYMNLGLAIHPVNGNPYVLYSDNTVGNKATVKSFSRQCSGVLNTYAVNQTGTYASIITNSYGCSDTTNQVTVTLRPLPTLTVSVIPSPTVCSGDPLTLTASGTGTLSWNNNVTNGVSIIPANSASYVASATNVYGCSTTLTVNTQVNPTYQLVQNKVFCSNYSYTLPGGSTTSASGTYIDSLNTMRGCDSVIISHLTFTNTLHGPNRTASICQGSSYQLPLGDLVTLSGTYRDTLTTAGGCDSVIMTNLTVNPTYSLQLPHVAICSTDSAFIFGNYRKFPGIYSDSLQSVHGCDSVLTKILTVNPVYSSQLPGLSICDHDSVLIFGNYQKLSGIYSGSFQTINGCDSLLSQALTVNTVNTVLSSNNNVLTAQAVNATYQWIKCNPNQVITGATNQSYTATTDGDYAVIVTRNGCSDTSACVNIVATLTGLHEKEDSTGYRLSIYPNPSDGFITIQSGELLHDATFTIMNELGQSIQVIKLHNTNKHTVNVEHLSNGIYFVVGFNNNKLTRQKIVISK